MVFVLSKFPLQVICDEIEICFVYKVGMKYCSRNCTSNSSAQWQLDETIPDYFNGVVLQRSSPGYPQSLTSLRFQSILTLGVVWIPVFLVLSKGKGIVTKSIV